MRRLLFSLVFLFALQGAFAEENNPYLAGGVPATDKPWTGKDYETAYAMIMSDTVPLPLYANPNGAEVMKRLTSLSNFDSMHNKELPVRTRLNNGLAILQSTALTLQYYAGKAEGEVPVHAEIAALMGFSLRSAAEVVTLVNELVPTLPKDETYAARMEGLKQMNDGLAQMFGGAQDSLGEREFYTAADLTLMLTAMLDTLPVMKSAFSPEFNLDMQTKLTAQKEFFEGDDLVMLVTMINLLKGVDDAPKSAVETAIEAVETDK